MSERKVLNKYYPPDFDPSKIPKCKEPRNKTFGIRLMAPCNMRCSTCGEYIYKGRKFNARKEDVDDMNYLGLRIYRFYIKCTACVSEICFRTDPENTDYVLESGATRNFEALKRAEEQAEREERAHREEIENNPMKLLEERTQASKNEMELAESLDELRELNRRTVNVDYDNMLQKYEDGRAARLAAAEKADEDFVNTVFSKDGHVKMKRILEDGSSSEEEKEKEKKVKTDNPTDHLTGHVKKPEKKEAWQRSIGALSSKKGGLGMLVKKKSTTANKNGAKPGAGAPADFKFTAPAAPKVSTSPLVQKNNGNPPTAAPKNPQPAATEKPVVIAGGGGLGLLGAYSDSGSGDSD